MSPIPPNITNKSAPDFNTELLIPPLLFWSPLETSWAPSAANRPNRKEDVQYVALLMGPAELKAGSVSSPAPGSLLRSDSCIHVLLSRSLGSALEINQTTSRDPVQRPAEEFLEEPNFSRGPHILDSPGLSRLPSPASHHSSKFKLARPF